MSELRLVVPAGIDDPSRPSGGNVYDRRISRGLRELGWVVGEHRLAGAWPSPEPEDRSALAGALAGLPDGALVLVDGIIGSAVPEILRAQAPRLRLVVLLHMPLDTPQERAALSAARGIVATSQWTRDWLREHVAGVAERVRVVHPGVDPAQPAPGSPAGRRLLCVGSVSRVKGQDVLLDALAAITDLPLSCTCVGALDVEPELADSLRRRLDRAVLRHRVTFTGALGGADLDRAYADADVLVQPSRAETYGMVVTEALARGLPVVAADVGGMSEALGRADDGSLPGVLVPPEDPWALADALREWLEDRDRREHLRVAARSRSRSLTGWPEACNALAAVLTEIAGA